MTIADLIEAASFDAFIGALCARLGTDQLMVFGHDLGALHPLEPQHGTGERQTITDRELLDGLLDGQTVQHDGHTYTPVASRRFPIVVAVDIDAGQTADLGPLGPVTMFQRELFDALEHQRRSTAFSPAAELQWSMLPLRAASVADFSVAGSLLPAASVAGDAYDFAIDLDGYLVAYAMDAMGHGVSATLSSSLALASLRTVRRDGGTLVEQVEAADRAILAEYGGDRFVTMAAVRCGPGSLEVINAGHEPVRRRTPDGRVTALDLAADPPLGLDGPTNYRRYDLEPLAPGEQLVMISDGAPEARGIDGKEFGTAAVDLAIASTGTGSPLQIADRVGRAVMEFVPGDLADDLTTVVIERMP